MANDNDYRTRPWIPDKVMLMDSVDSIMINPDGAINLPIDLRLRLIVCRNLSRRVIQKCMEIK